jgi:hypothetical protein
MVSKNSRRLGAKLAHQADVELVDQGANGRDNPPIAAPASRRGGATRPGSDCRQRSPNHPINRVAAFVRIRWPLLPRNPHYSEPNLFTVLERSR